MKTLIFKSIFVVALIATLGSCKEDIYLHGGKDGKDGKNGFSSLVMFDPQTQTKIYYLDRDSSWDLTPKDSILYQETKDGYKIVPSGQGCYEIIKIVGTSETSVGFVCNGEDGSQGPIGPEGPAGDNAMLVMEIVPDTEYCKSGQRVVFRSLQNHEAVDSLSYCVPADGKDGKDGKDFDISDLVFSSDSYPIDSLCWVRIVSINGKELFRDTICNGAQGEPGETPQPYIPYWSKDEYPISDLCKVRVVYLDGEEFFRDTICNGAQGDPGENGKDGTCRTIIRESFSENFNNGNSYSYEARGWTSSWKGFSINSYLYSYGPEADNGSMVFWYYKTQCVDTIWTPQLFSEPMALDSIYYLVGSQKLWSYEILAKDKTGEIYLIYKGDLNPSSGFDWTQTGTYSENYFAWRFDELQFRDIVKVGVVAVRKTKVSNRNESFNLDNLYVRGIKLLN